MERHMTGTVVREPHLHDGKRYHRAAGRGARRPRATGARTAWPTLASGRARSELVMNPAMRTQTEQRNRENEIEPTDSTVGNSDHLMRNNHVLQNAAAPRHCVRARAASQGGGCMTGCC